MICQIQHPSRIHVQTSILSVCAIRKVPTAWCRCLCSSIYTEIDGHIRIRSLPCEIASIIQMLINPNRLKHTISLDCIHIHTYTMVYMEYFTCICYRARALYHFIRRFMSCPHVVCASCAVVFIDFGASLFACSTQGTSPYSHTHTQQASTHTCVVCVLDFAIYALIFICHIVLFARDL